MDGETFLNNKWILLRFNKIFAKVCPTGFCKCQTEFHFFRPLCPTGFEKLFAAQFHEWSLVMFKILCNFAKCCVQELKNSATRKMKEAQATVNRKKGREIIRFCSICEVLIFLCCYLYDWVQYALKGWVFFKTFCYRFSVFQLFQYYLLHSVHWGINPPPPPQKHHPLLLAKPPCKSTNCPSPLFRQSPLYISFS